MQKIVVEVCCGSAADAFTAKAAGADRVELCSALDLGGLTPSMGELRLAKKAGIPVMSMARARAGGFCYTDMEFETMLLDISLMLEAGADGIVFGILTRDGDVDCERCKIVLDAIGDRESVFHRAIDVTPDWRAAMDRLCDLGVRRVLTSGQAATAVAGAATLAEMMDYAAGRIEVLPGAGIRRENAVSLLETTGCRQLHVSMRKAVADPSANARPEIKFGGASENSYTLTDFEMLRELIEAVSL